MPSLLTIFVILFIVADISAFIYIGGYDKWDVQGHWRICKYTLEGYNPYLLVGTDAAVESIGEIPKGFSTVPWSCVFGSFFYGGFLPLHIAEVYILVLHFLSVTALSYILWQKLHTLVTGKLMFALLCIPISHFSFIYSIIFGNAGGIICTLLIISLLICDDHPVSAGVLFGLTMMKPQISAIFGLIFLLKKQWTILFISGTIVITGWAATSFTTHTAPFALLQQTIIEGTALEEQYLGLLSNLKYCNIDSRIIMLINMMLGVIYVLGSYFYLRKNSPSSLHSPFVFVSASIASVFWTYKNGTDYMIVSFAALFFCLLCLKESLTKRDCLGIAFSVSYLQMSRVVVYLSGILFEDYHSMRDAIKSIDGLVIGLIGVYLYHLWVKHKGIAVFTIAK